MTTARNLPSAVRDSLTKLAESGDRTPPTVFVGREDEFALLDAAMRGTRDGDLGRTVVIQGVPGAGKTALLHEHALRVVTDADETGPAIIPVPLRHSDLNAPPGTIVEEIDRQFREFEPTSEVRKRGGSKNQLIGGAAFVGKTLFATLTRRDFKDFRPSARALHSLPIAIDDHMAFRFDRRNAAILLLVDEAQNLEDTRHVRAHLDAIHGGVHGRTSVMLACFGLARTTERLRELGLSRLATGHVRTIGQLSDDEARHTCTATLEEVFVDHPFDDIRRTRWIGHAVDAILDESANFPHHLANGCRALAGVVLEEGIADEAPVVRVREQCARHRREYYDLRLQPWSDHTIALAHAFGDGDDGWKPVDRIMRAVMAADNMGLPVDERTAATTLKEICANGFLEMNVGECRSALPSLTSHFAAIRQGLKSNNVAARKVRSALIRDQADRHESMREEQ